MAREGTALGIRREGVVEWLTLADVVIGRLVTFGWTDDQEGDREFGFELILPPRIGAPLHAAMAVDQALARHRAVRKSERALANT
jgi:hypothetical protein